MSNAIYPALPGLTWSVTKSPIWKVRTQTSVRGREVRIKDQIYPRWKFQLIYSFLRGMPGYQEVQAMMDLFNNLGGSWDTFYFTDPTDSQALGQPIGVGDGTTVQFQLGRQMKPNGFFEPITAPQVPTAVYFNNVVEMSNAISADGNTGLLTFASPPGAGVVISVDFSYYFRCRFTTDTLDFEQFMSNWWELKKVEFESVLL